MKTMTLQQIVRESDGLPQEQLAELVDHLLVKLHSGIAPDIEESWKVETRRRIAEIESGRETGVPGAEVSARIRKIVGR
jgi:putative addiction module component (TIGR02574 family)